MVFIQKENQKVQITFGLYLFLDGSSTADEISDFFKMLGGGSQSQVADEPKADDDQEFERKQDVRLFLNLLYFQI